MSDEGMNRRDFLKGAGAATGGALLASCTPKPDKKFISPVMPPDRPPGMPYHFDSVCTECPAGCGVQVKAYAKYQGDTAKIFPVKLEGAKGNPVNGLYGRGALCVRGQSSLTRLYHPARVKGPWAKTKEGKWEGISWEEALGKIRSAIGERGRRHEWLAGRTTGSLRDLVGRLKAKFGVEVLPEYEVYSHAPLRNAYHALFGIGDVPQYRIEEADFLFTVGADIVETFVSPVSYTMQAAALRKKGHKWFHAEPHLSLSGIRADERFVLNAGSEPYLLAYLLSQLDLARLPGPVRDALPRPRREDVSKLTGLPKDQLDRLASSLKNADRPLLIAGGISLAHAFGLETALLAGLIQWSTAMIGERIDFRTTENYASVGDLNDLDGLSRRLADGKVGVVFFAWTDPIATAPSSIPLRENLKKASLRVALTDLMDETARECDLVLPLSHALESFGDAEPRKGLWTPYRPVMDRLDDTRSAGDILLALLGEKETYESYLKRQGPRPPLPEVKVALRVSQDAIAILKKGQGGWPLESREALIVVPSLRSFDGRSRALPLLQEIPDPLTTVTYGLFASVSEAAAQKLSLEDRDEIEVASADVKLKLPVKVQPGLPEGVVTVQRDMAPAIVAGWDRRTGEAAAIVSGITVRKGGSRVPGEAMPVMSGSMSQHGRGIIQGKGQETAHLPPPYKPGENGLYPVHDHGKLSGYDWSMAIDLQACTGCSACVAACYIENNVPVVGAWDHWKGREMSWIRIEPYKDPHGIPRFIPMMCQHCHNAPCEPVCPVYATMHNEEGLNAQVYNRCVGTRYCSNNCPYKVRRFNWWDHQWRGPLVWMQNPELTVRTAGIMEKCTFCVQRIRTAKDRAKDDRDRKYLESKDGPIQPACAQTCPTEAIVFGNILDKESRVYRLAKESGRSYRVFDYLGTDPSVHYLK